MTSPASTSEGKVVLYHATTGQRREFWPVDARGILGTGEYTADPQSGAPATSASVDPAPEHPIPEIPTEYAPGVPLVVTRAHEAEPLAPLQEPERVTRRRKA